MQLGATGVWSVELRFDPDAAAIADAAAELEELGYGALWTPGGVGGDIMGAVSRLLDATVAVPVATGILNIWMHEPEDVAADRRDIQAVHPGRLLLGLGRSHAPLVNGDGGDRYRRPLAAMTAYLDRLDAAQPPVPVAGRVLASLGPRSLEMARERSAGAHPYFMPVEHTSYAREILGAASLLAPEQAVVLDTDPETARATARAYMELYLGLPNYTDNLVRFGFGSDDLKDGGSDRLVDAIVVWGDEERIAARIAEQHAAGADHVCIQVLGAEPGQMPRDAWRRLAPALVN